MSIQVIHNIYKCHIGDVHLHTGFFVLKMVNKLNIHEIDLEDNDSLLFGAEDELDKFNHLLSPYTDKILHKTTRTSLKIVEAKFELSETAIEYLQEFLFNNITVNDILDKVNREGMENISNIEMKILNFHSQL